MNKFPNYVMRRCRERLDLEPDDTSKDYIINKYSAKSAIDEVLIWEGIIGYTDFIVELVEDCYCILLTEGEDE